MRDYTHAFKRLGRMLEESRQFARETPPSWPQTKAEWKRGDRIERAIKRLIGRRKRDMDEAHAIR